MQQECVPVGEKYRAEWWSWQAAGHAAVRRMKSRAADRNNSKI